MSHEVRTPAAAIITAAGLLQSRGPLSEEQQDVLPIVSEGATQILNLVQDAMTAGAEGDEFTLNPRVVDPWGDVIERVRGELGA